MLGVALVACLFAGMLLNNEIKSKAEIMEKAISFEGCEFNLAEAALGYAKAAECTLRLLSEKEHKKNPEVYPVLIQLALQSLECSIKSCSILLEMPRANGDPSSLDTVKRDYGHNLDKLLGDLKKHLRYAEFSTLMLESGRVKEVDLVSTLLQSSGDLSFEKTREVYKNRKLAYLQFEPLLEDAAKEDEGDKKTGGVVIFGHYSELRGAVKGCRQVAENIDALVEEGRRYLKIKEKRKVTV